jgi:hypothetical protein
VVDAVVDAPVDFTPTDAHPPTATATHANTPSAGGTAEVRSEIQRRMW